jgi:hypothetical protein
MVSRSPDGVVDIFAGKGKLPAQDFSANVFVVLTKGSSEEYIRCGEAFGELRPDMSPVKRRLSGRKAIWDTEIIESIQQPKRFNREQDLVNSS